MLTPVGSFDPQNAGQQATLSRSPLITQLDLPDGYVKV